MRLGVDAVLVDDRMVAGDVDVSDGRIDRLGLPAAGSGRIAAPGLVDLQVNGFAGVDLLAADRADIDRMALALAASGVTAWQPTLITAPEDDVTRALAVLRDALSDPPVGARMVGIHLEGPFLAPSRMGTHPPEHRRDADLALLQRMLKGGGVTTVTLAPERPGAIQLIDHLITAGVVVSAGHTDADADSAHVGIARGVTTVTHLFNAMRPFRTRDPGIVGVALASPDVVVQIIVDGHHLDPDTVRLVFAAAEGRVALVTDAIAAAAAGDGPARLGDVEIMVVDGVARREDGTLAGSTLTMLDAVRNCVALGLDSATVLRAATTVPATVLGRRDLGCVHQGGPADLIVLDDNLELAQVLLHGHPVEAAGP